MYQEYEMKNGLRVITSPMPYMESVSLGLWIGTGGRYEAKSESGISHLIEHMLFKGTVKRDARKLKEAIEGIGGFFNGFTADEVTCYMVKVPSSHVNLGMDILSDMVFNSLFDNNELEKEKYVVCEEIKMYRDHPSDYVEEILSELMWPDNSLGRPLTGTIETVKSFTRDSLLSYTGSHYFPSNMAITAIGKVKHENIKKLADSIETKVKNKKKKKVEKPSDCQKTFKTKFVPKSISQSHLAIGFRTGAPTLKERFALKILNIILGGNMSSRLFEELREKNGLCYDIASNYKRHSDTGEFVIHSGVDNKKCERSVRAIIEELVKIKEDGITVDELLRAKEYAKGQFLLSLEGTSSRMMWIGYRYMIDGRIPEVKELLNGIEAVTADDVKKISRKIFKHNALNLAVVGNVSAKSKEGIKKAFKKL